mmetsp:Transcript_85720/g.239620  ORF Transcript_85720/g.239620 Transcript_85720/m.239620 type:complete len:237 (+) Transcript_85720:1334-2044(+)
MRVRYENLVAGALCGGCPIRLVVFVAPRDNALGIVVRFVAHVERHNQRVVSIPMGELLEASDPLALVVLGDVPISLVLVDVAAPTRLRDVIVDDDHEALVSKRLDHFVEDVKEAHAAKLGIGGNVFVRDTRVLYVTLRAVRQPDAIEAELRNAPRQIPQGLDLEASNDGGLRIRPRPVDACPLHAHVVAIDDVPAQRVQRQLVLANKRRTLRGAVRCRHRFRGLHNGDAGSDGGDK